jgi:hypothetical protein
MRVVRGSRHVGVSVVACVTATVAAAGGAIAWEWLYGWSWRTFSRDPAEWLIVIPALLAAGLTRIAVVQLSGRAHVGAHASAIGVLATGSCAIGLLLLSSEQVMICWPGPVEGITLELFGRMPSWSMFLAAVVGTFLLTSRAEGPDNNEMQQTRSAHPDGGPRC